MKIVIVTPAASRVRNGNRNTAQRWATFLRQLGHRVCVQVEWDGSGVDLMLALHARRSHASIKRFAECWPELPLIVALTGTDLYRDIRNDCSAQESMQLATHLVVLQEMGLNELAPALREKTHVIYQSARPVKSVQPFKRCFEACVIGNLREEKDPFRSALAAALLPENSEVHITHMGRALNDDMARQAQVLMEKNPRYHWLGELPHWKVRNRLARCRLMVITSIMEGGANVVSEALAVGVPVIASDISGNIGMLGADYAGFYPCGNERALASLLLHAETSPKFYDLLKAQCAKRKPLVEPGQELAGLEQLIATASATSSLPDGPIPAPRAGKAA
ncbi:glycosyltransferase [Sulfuricella denitrificans skB26]|uniref:Glycosyltransferase n=1 Tax=Sulfuricella denitrificans (strain DSM 22764 / NBRC 105220 / skB26) TaxID=1163617 RepID=S6AH50_SULDS|nr:selenoneine biosynthesis selenosugar synthase SenB [Sulfuricella denitrificans]BAN35436.1 glycosyltransferase [Sulfuricella denitrificans skB26]